MEVGWKFNLRTCKNTVSLTSDSDQILLLLISFHLSKFVPVNDKFPFLFFSSHLYL